VLVVRERVGFSSHGVFEPRTIIATMAPVELVVFSRT
jgi:hypothetical protein